ncbi:dGTPase [Ramlibacter sp. MMS24-I3-19]|uniref:dGTPase n=1 Tax=Ramlibacter sp. MMS24-I3-19 TaxID=3416606 RepID=UPI003D03FC7C
MPSTSTYSTLLSNKRERTSTLAARSIAVEAESDRGRLIFSAPFRRLQQKAQVFSLEPNAAVRSRLTHSIEVSQIGRFIADLVVERLTADVQAAVDTLQARALVTFVEVACLMHDLGNPPFGHFGEAAIADWFRTRGPEVLRSVLSGANLSVPDPDVESALADFVEFDGNCQGLRIAALLQWNDDPYGLNLTYTSLASYLKYLRAPNFQIDHPDKRRPFRKKAGFFSTEAALVQKIWTHFGIDPGAPRRFPLAYIMEAADDIAYCISDLEDSIEKGLLTSLKVFQDLAAQWNSIGSPFAGTTLAGQLSQILAKAADPSAPDISRFTIFRTSLSRVLCVAASDEYVSKHEEILTGRPSGLIARGTPGGEMLEMLKAYCREHVYHAASIERKELAGLAAVRGLLDHFACLLKCSDSRFEATLDGQDKDPSGRSLLVERKLLSIFPERYKLAYQHASSSHTGNSATAALARWNLRAHLVTDFISGMTDDFALWSFQMLSGIRTG